MIDGARAALSHREELLGDNSSNSFATRWLCDGGEGEKRREVVKEWGHPQRIYTRTGILGRGWRGAYLTQGCVPGNHTRSARNKSRAGWATAKREAISPVPIPLDP